MYDVCSSTRPFIARQQRVFPHSCSIFGLCLLNTPLFWVESPSFEFSLMRQRGETTVKTSLRLNQAHKKTPSQSFGLLRTELLNLLGSADRLLPASICPFTPACETSIRWKLESLIAPNSMRMKTATSQQIGSFLTAIYWLTFSVPVIAPCL